MAARERRSIASPLSTRHGVVSSSFALQHEAATSSLIGPITGALSWQRGSAKWQRGAKTQPVSAERTSGNRPGIG